MGSRRLLPLVLCLLMATSYARADFFSFIFGNQPRFSGSQLYTYYAGLENLSGTPGAFGDFNADKFSDVFWISHDKKVVTVYFWKSGSYEFEQSSASVSITDGSTVANVVPGDFNYDGRLDVLIFTLSGADYTATLYTGDLSTLTKSTQAAVTGLKDQLLVADMNGDMKPDMFGGDGTTWYTYINNGEGAFTRNEFIGSGYEMPVPHGNAFVDLSGDCKADLFVKSKNTSGKYVFELWVNKGGHFEKGFEHVMGGDEYQYTEVAFADFDANGSIDMAWGTCSGTDCSSSSIHVVFNVQQGMCNNVFTTKSSTCRPQTDLCKDSGYNLDAIAQPGTANHVVISSETFVGNALQPASDTGALTLRVGDMDMDGYPDLLVPILSGGKKLMQVWKNVKCNGACSSDASKAGKRSFEPQTSSDYSALNNIENAVAAAFFDFNEAGGPLDVLVIATGDGITYARTLYNNMFTDAFYLQALGLNGVCVEWCSSGDRFPDPRPYGVSQPGVTYRYTVTDIQGDKTMKQTPQLTQSSYMALQLPYARMGLGRTNNYVEEFEAGTTINSDDDTRSWTSIIPNSQLIMSPHEPSDPSEWTLYLYISPSAKIVWVTLFVIFSIVVMAGIIAFQTWREKVQDEKEKKDNAHVFSFDAL